ncbi:MAG TPA: TfoX/Sxy family protein [Anaerolineales bacterium]|nr:TfoX/Sxy family protein [Anaerolineales bacterium]
MPYDEQLAARLKSILKGTGGLEEKKMFGGVGYLVDGNMACGVHKQALILRLGEAKFEATLKLPHARVFDITGKPMKGWILLDREGCRSELVLRRLVRDSVAFARSLPPK